jgi:hypothetical protein
MNATVIEFTKLHGLHDDLRITPYLLEIDGGPVPTPTPVHFQIVLDTSSSMSLENRLKHIQRTLIALVPHLRDNDLISLYTFNENVSYYGDYIMPAGRDKFIETVRALYLYGGTNIGGALRKLERRIKCDSLVLFLTDGMPTCGHTEWSYFTGKLDLMYNKGARFVFVGYGASHDAALLGHLAKHIDGEYYSICNKMSVADVIGSIVGGAFTTVARNIRVYSSSEIIHTVPSMIAEMKYYVPITWKPTAVDGMEIVYRDATEADIPLLVRECIRNKLQTTNDVGSLYDLLGDDPMAQLIKKKIAAIKDGNREHEEQHRVFFRLQRGIYTPTGDDDVVIISNQTQSILSQQL